MIILFLLFLLATALTGIPRWTQLMTSGGPGGKRSMRKSPRILNPKLKPQNSFSAKNATQTCKSKKRDIPKIPSTAFLLQKKLAVWTHLKKSSSNWITFPREGRKYKKVETTTQTKGTLISTPSFDLVKDGKKLATNGFEWSLRFNSPMKSNVLQYNLGGILACLTNRFPSQF